MRPVSINAAIVAIDELQISSKIMGKTALDSGKAGFSPTWDQVMKSSQHAPEPRIASRENSERTRTLQIIGWQSHEREQRSTGRGPLPQPKKMPLRNVWASPAARDATKEERAAHAQCTTREEAVRLLQVMARSWGVEPEAADEGEGLCAALCCVLKRLGRDVRTAYLLEANLDAWIKENEARTRNGARQDQRLLAASALYDVRVVVLSTASPEALAYDADPEKPTDEVTLGHCHAEHYARFPVLISARWRGG